MTSSSSSPKARARGARTATRIAEPAGGGASRSQCGAPTVPLSVGAIDLCDHARRPCRRANAIGRVTRGRWMVAVDGAGGQGERPGRRAWAARQRQGFGAIAIAQADRCPGLAIQAQRVEHPDAGGTAAAAARLGKARKIPTARATAHSPSGTLLFATERACRSAPVGALRGVALLPFGRGLYVRWRSQSTRLRGGRSAAPRAICADRR